MRIISNTTGLLILLASTTLLGYFLYKNVPAKADHPAAVQLRGAAKKPPVEKNTKARDEKLSGISSALKSFSQRKGYNKEIAFLVDMSIPSGENRFFIYNMEKDSIEKAALVTHGYGSRKNDIEFSNVPGSYCTSLGKYKVGAAYNGRFGLAYKLHGLDKTNDKAFERFVVLHAHDCVPAEEVAPLPICESQGCPTVAPSFLQELKKCIESSDKPILLNIYH